MNYENFEKFANEFNDLTVKKFGLKEVIGQGLHVEDDGLVYLEALILNGGEEIRVRVLNAPSWNLELMYPSDLVVDVASSLDLSEEEVITRLKRCELLDDDFKLED